MELRLKNGQTVLLDDDIDDSVHHYAWTVKGGTDRVIASWRDPETKKVIQRTLNEFVCGEALPRGYVFHHKDGDPWNFRRENIELVQRGKHHALAFGHPAGHQAMLERERSGSARHHNRTGYRGVVASQGRYKAQVSLRGTRHYLGYFDTPEEAARAYDNALVGAGLAPVNFPA